MSNHPNDENCRQNKKKFSNRFSSDSLKKIYRVLPDREAFCKSIGVEVKHSKMTRAMEKKLMKNQDSYENKNQTSQSLREVGGNQMELEQNRISLEEREHMGTGSNNGSHFVSYSGTPSCISDSDKDTSNIHANNQNIIGLTEQANQSGGSTELKMI